MEDKGSWSLGCFKEIQTSLTPYLSPKPKALQLSTLSMKTVNTKKSVKPGNTFGSYGLPDLEFLWSRAKRFSV